MKRFFFFIFIFLPILPAEIIIDQPGIVQLGSDINFAPTASGDAAIMITASDVTLDMAQRKIEQTNATALTSAIEIGPSVSNVTIKNGLILNLQENGILVQEGCQDCSIHNITIMGSKRGIVFEGAVNNQIERCSVLENDILASSTAIAISNARCNNFVHNSFSSISQIGFDSLLSFTNTISDSDISCLNSVQSGMALHFNNGGGSLIESNQIKQLLSTSSSRNDRINGIFLGLNERSNVIRSNKIQGVTASGQAFANGIQLGYQPTAFTTLQTIGVGAIIYDVRWSPDERFLAVAIDNEIRVYAVKNTSLVQLDSIGAGPSVRTARWSPDGRYLAIGINAGAISVQVFEFNGVALNSITTFAGSSVEDGIMWSPNGDFIAVAQQGANDIIILRFNGSTLTTAGTAAVASTGVRAFWHPTGRYVGLTTNGSSGLVIYSYNGTTLTPVVTIPFTGSIWIGTFSPDGRYLAIGGTTGTLLVYEFNGTVAALVASYVFTGATDVEDISFTSDNRYIAIVGNGNGGRADILQFDGATLSLFTSIAGPGSTFCETIQISPTGKFIARGTRTAPIQINLFTGFNFSQGHSIVNNKIFNVTHPGLGQQKIGGIGILGSSSVNNITNNQGYSSNLNYAFITTPFRTGVNNIRESSTFPNRLSNSSFGDVYSGNF